MSFHALVPCVCDMNVSRTATKLSFHVFIALVPKPNVAVLVRCEVVKLTSDPVPNVRFNAAKTILVGLPIR